MPDNPQNVAPVRKPYPWNKEREKAALLVSLDELTDKQIAEELNIGLRTLGDWKVVPAFRKRVEEHIAEFRSRVRRRGIAIVENRIAHLQRRHDKMNQVIVERGKDPEMQRVPGGSTGLLVHNVKSIGSGESAERVDLYEVDTALLKELREHEKQAAQELGQWTEKHEHGGELTVKGYAGVTPDDWDSPKDAHGGDLPAASVADIAMEG